MARNLTDAEEPFLGHTRFLIMDRDIKYSAASPNLNAYAERFVRSVKTECTGRMVFFSRSSLECALSDYVAHYHEEGNHQGLQNRLLKCSDGPVDLGVERRETLGGMLNFYHRRPEG